MYSAIPGLILFSNPQRMSAPWIFYQPTFHHEQDLHDLHLPWSGHKRFAYDLVRFLTPKVIVELGTYKGSSFFAFAQAVADGGFPCDLHAIDTWQGDKHAGHYDEVMYEEVCTLGQTHYPSLDLHYHRMTFDEARADFAEGSIDLLHIDGLHTYEAVLHDYTTWLPKVRPGGVILFHDIAERQQDFGVWKLWEDIKDSGQSIAFQHSHGLGVLVVGNTEVLPSNIHSFPDIYADHHAVALLREEVDMKATHIRNLEAELAAREEKLLTLRQEYIQIQEAHEAQGRHVRTLEHTAREYAIVQLSLSYKLMRLQGSLTTMLRHPKRTLSDIGQGLALLKREGAGAFRDRLRAYLQGYRTPHEIPHRDVEERAAYEKYCALEDWSEEEKAAFAASYSALATPPRFAILVPVYNIAPEFLARCIESVRAQLYPHWELCLYDDCSTNQDTLEYLRALAEHDDPKIRIQFGKTNQNIAGATNAAAEMSDAPYIALLDHDDELHPLALAEVTRRILEVDPDVLYTDEDHMDLEGHRFSPHFKPDYSPDLLLSHNYVTHFLVFRRDLFGKGEDIFRLGTEGAQDHDLILRLTEKTSSIDHIPKVLYHWRYLESSTSKNPASQPVVLEKSKKVLEDALARREIHGIVEHANAPFWFRVKREIQGTPLVSILIPFKDKPDLLRLSIGSVLEKSTYPHFEILGISNNSTDPATFTVMRELEERDSRVRFLEHNVPFNYSEINNTGVREARGEYIVLMNNDIEILSPDWIESMLEHAQRPEVGAVGAKLYFPNDTIQHAGVVLGIGGIAGHAYKNLPRKTFGYFNRINVIHNVVAVTAALLMVKKSTYVAVGGLEEEGLKVAFNDVDFCVRLHKAGYWNIFTPYAEAYHHESVSRGAEDTPEKIARFQGEIDFFAQRHEDILTAGDPFYNKNLCLIHEDYRLRRSTSV